MLVSETSSTTQYICSLENIKINSNPKNLPEIIPTDEKSLDLYDEFSIKINNISTEFYSQTELYDVYICYYYIIIYFILFNRLKGIRIK